VKRDVAYDRVIDLRYPRAKSIVGHDERAKVARTLAGVAVRALHLGRDRGELIDVALLARSDDDG